MIQIRRLSSVNLVEKTLTYAMVFKIIFRNPRITLRFLLSNPLDNPKTKLLKTKTVDFSINNTYFGLSFRYAQVNSFLLIPFFEEKFSYISSNDCLSKPVS